MILKVVYFLVLVTISGVLSKHKNESWDFLVLTVEWPPAYRFGRENCSNITAVNGWNIHGLWPSSSIRNDPVCCKNASKFDINKLKPIMQELLAEWNPLGKCNNNFWEHEWKNHGTCAIKDKLIKTQLQYFNTTINMKKQLDLTNLLKKNNIVPDNKKLYSTDNITNIIVKQFNVKPQIRCVTDQDKVYIISISICFNKDLKVIECPHRHKLIYYDRHHPHKCGKRRDSTAPIRIPCERGFIYAPF